VPTILRFRNFNIGIYLADHFPGHVHAVGPGVEAIFLTNCWKGPVELRTRKGTTLAEERALVEFLTTNLEIICKAWEAIHGDPTRT
jgi:hypothetical protein